MKSCHKVLRGFSTEVLFKHFKSFQFPFLRKFISPWQWEGILLVSVKRVQVYQYLRLQSHFCSSLPPSSRNLRVVIVVNYSDNQFFMRLTRVIQCWFQCIWFKFTSIFFFSHIFVQVFLFIQDAARGDCSQLHCQTVQET